MRPTRIIFPLVALLGNGAGADAADYMLESPSGQVCVSLHVDDADGKLCYEVSRGGKPVVGRSSMGLVLNTAILDSMAGEPTATYSSCGETYSLPHGKHAEYHDAYNEITLSGSRRSLSVRMRAYDDGVAFRYELESRTGSSVLEDLSEFNFTDFKASWAQGYHADYSWYYEKRGWTAMGETSEYNVPMLIRTSHAIYALITESASTSSMAAGRLTADGETGHLRLRHPHSSSITDKNFVSPWRTIIIGTLPEITESTMTANLNPPSSMDDTSWIRPGRVAWNWGAEDGDSAPTPELARRYIDFAAAMGWEYFLLDDGWDGRIDLEETVRYAESKNVGLLIWAHQNEFHNDYSHIDVLFRDWARMGIKGLKIDFFEDDSQEMLRKYGHMLKAAAANRLMLNFHGCTKPSGLERTWPHLMTSEAVLGGEFYMFNTTMTPGSHTVNLALTRNVLGGMDYTPVKFGNKRGRMITDTSWAYQLALATAFESSLQSICDTPENILGSIAEPLLRQLPVCWDETRCLEAEPDNYITLARRKGEDWWIASLTSGEREITVPTDFLATDGSWDAHIYTEGFHRSDIHYELRVVSPGETITLNVGHDSGATVVLTRNQSFLRPFTLKMEAEKYNRLCQRVDDVRCSGGAYLDGLGGRKMIKLSEVDVPAGGDYNLTLFYISKGERDAYMEINGGEKEYYHFLDTGGNVYFTTVTVRLEEGHNEINIGNETGTAPGFDRFVISRLDDGNLEGSGVEGLTTSAFADIWWEGGKVKVTALMPSLLTAYSQDGRMLMRKEVPAGETELRLGCEGIVFVNVAGAGQSLTRKLILH